jgi:hypothetical protein
VATLVLAVVAGSVPGRTAAADADAAADTVRTNLWLVETLMREVVQVATANLPAPPAGVQLVAQAEGEAEDLLTQIIVEELNGTGYAVYMASAEADSTDAASASSGDGAAYELRYRVLQTELAYPATGRRLGIWREWVARNLELTVMITLSELGTGRVLFNDRISRSFRDRVPSEYLEDVESGLYPFTQAETQESGWQNRVEEIVVLGALAGLVAVYFANTR